MRIKYTILFILSLSIAFGQNPIFNEVYLSGDYNVNDICQDSLGFIWLATEKGLVFYDGIEDQIVNDSSCVGNEVFTIHIAENCVFSGMANGLVSKTDGLGRNITDFTQLPTESRISDIIIGKGNIEIYGTYGDGLYIIKPADTLHISIETGLSSNYIYEVIYLNDGRILCATDRGIDVIGNNLKIVNTLEDLPDIIVTHLIAENDSLLWASNYDLGIFSINTSNYRITEYIFEERMKILDIIYQEEAIIASTVKGLFRFSEVGIIDTIFMPDEANFKIQSLLIDSENNLWLAGNQNPLWRASMYFQKYPINFNNEIQSLLDFGNRLLLGSNNGLILLDKRSKETSIILEGLNITVLKQIQKCLFIGTYSKGIYILNEDLKIIQHLDKVQGLNDNTILDIEPVKDNQVIASTLSGLINLKRLADDGNYFYDPSFNINKDLYYVLDIYSDKADNIWLGKDKAGVTRISNSYDLNPSPIDSTLKLGSVYSIATASDGYTYISSVNLGILKVDSTKLTPIISVTDKEEAYSSIISLSNNNLLLVRSSGVDLYNVKKGHIMYYDREAGIHSGQPYLNNYSINGNKVWFLHHNSLYQFYMPEEKQKIHPSTSLDKIEVNLDRMPNDRYSYSQSENNFRFSFTGAWMSDPDKLSYSYFLEGFDNTWRATKDRVVSYPHLPPGKYSFMVKSSENNKFSDEPIATYSFEIKIAFYNTSWFYILLTSALLGIGYLLLKRDQRERSLRAELSQKKIETQLINLKSQLNPHFLFNSFNTLIGLIEENKERGVSYVEHLTDFYRSILDIGKEELIPLSKEIHLVKLYAFLLKERFDTALEIHINESPAENVLIPPLTLQMLVENAVKHNVVSEKQKLIINININEKGIRILNNLNLKISKERSTNIGLENIKRRYFLLSGKDIEVNQSRGTFTVNLPHLR